jgi:hypothetical protein
MNYSTAVAFNGINFIPPWVKISQAVQKDKTGPCEQTPSHASRDLTHFLFPFKQVKSVKCLLVTFNNLKTIFLRDNAIELN